MTNATDSAFLFIYNNSASISTTEGGGFPKHDISLSFTDTLSEGTYKLGDGNFTAFINKKFDENSSNNYPVFDATLEIESNSVSSGQRAIKAKFNLSGVYFLTQDTIKVTEGSFYLKEEGFMLN